MIWVWNLGNIKVILLKCRAVYVLVGITYYIVAEKIVKANNLLYKITNRQGASDVIKAHPFIVLKINI